MNSLLTSTQQKLSEARPELQELDKEIRNIYVTLGDEGAADKHFEEADAISDNHSPSLRKIDKTLRKNQELKSHSSADSSASRQLKHPSLKLPKMALPIFDGDRHGSVSGMFSERKYTR